MKYELFYLIGASQEAQVPEIKKQVEEIVVSEGGKFEVKETLEKRRLSYNIKKETHGIYIAQRFELEKNENIKEINQKLNLNNAIIRFIISKADELPELKSKEERIATQASQEKKAIVPEKEEKTIIKKEEIIPTNAKTDKKENEVKEENAIDKKIEEILNI